MKRLVCLLGSVLLSVSCSQAPQTITTSRSTSKAEPLPDWVNRSALPQELQAHAETWGEKKPPFRGRACTLRVVYYDVQDRFLQSERATLPAIGRDQCSLLSADAAKALFDRLDRAPDAEKLDDTGVMLGEGQWCTAEIGSDATSDTPRTGRFFAVRPSDVSDHSCVVTFAAQGIVNRPAGEPGHKRTWAVSEQSRLASQEWCALATDCGYQGSTILLAIGLVEISEPVN